MPQSSTRYLPSSHRYLSKVSINTKQLHQIPSKTASTRSQINKCKIIGIVVATIAVVCVSLAMVLPFIVNIHQNESNTTITTTPINLITSNLTVTLITGGMTIASSITTTTTDSTTSTSTTTASATTTTETTTSVTTITDTTTTTATTTTTTANPYACSNITILDGFDLPGNDLTFQYTANYTLCCAFCLSNSSCMAFTWVKATGSSSCYLKYAASSSPGVNSALVSVHF